MKPERNRPFAILMATFAGIGGFLFGYDTGVISGAILFMAKQYHLSSVQQEAVISILLLGAAVGALFAGRLADRWGRKRVILGAALLFIIGALLFSGAVHISMLFIGRAIIGLAIGTASMTVPLFVSELSPSSMRGLCVSINQLLITIGIVVAYGVDYLFAPIEGWRWMVGLGALPALLLLWGMAYLPETPRWLIQRGKEAEARMVLRRIGYQSEEQNEIIGQVESQLEKQPARHLLFSRKMRMPLLIGMGLALFQQITGINTVIYYAPTLFQMAGVGSASAAILATVGVGVVNVLATLVALFLLDRVGRKPLLIVGISGMIGALVVLGAVWAFPEGGGAIRHGLGLALMVYIVGFAIGLGPIAWLIIAEIYPLRVRGAAMSCATVTNWGANFLTAMTFLSLIHAIGAGWTFWLYALLSVGSLLFVIRFVPETKGKSLEELEQLLDKK